MTELIHEFKEYINKGDTAGFIAELRGYDVPLDYIVYLHACEGCYCGAPHGPRQHHTDCDSAGISWLSSRPNVI
jgi:hypothetical protein